MRDFRARALPVLKPVTIVADDHSAPARRRAQRAGV